MIDRAGRQTASLHVATGTLASTAIGRVSFTLGLEGPALAVDTACSSSLVAVHQAMMALKGGDADLVLAGGVNAILTPMGGELLAKGGALAVDGLCKTFDASADGYVRGEGCGIVVLKRLQDAQADGDRIWAVIRGSAVNQDGASAGLTVPNGLAQERVIGEALARAGLQPADVDYLEAHGTGTELGDPIEVQAAATAYGPGRKPDRPLLIGSVKTNIGHLEAAAGIAGLIKVALSMEHGTLPKHLHFHRPNPRIDWDDLAVDVTAQSRPWPEATDRPVRAGVSSFGISGTNAHVVLEAPPVDGSGRGLAVPAAGRASDASAFLEPRGRRLLPLSGKSPRAVRELAGRYLSWLGSRPGGLAGGDHESASLLADVAWTAAVGRTHFRYRAGLVHRDLGELQAGLEVLVEDREIARAGRAPKVAFVFTGQGSQWAGMGRALYEREPAVREVLDRCEREMRELRGASLLEVMFGQPGAAGDLDDTAWTQPALYALECAVAAQWASLGVRPAAVLGHSVGEIAAAQVAGVFGLEDGLRFAAARGELMGALPVEGPAAGSMLAIYAPARRVAAAVEEHNAGLEGVGLSLAAENGAHRVVSGPTAEIEALAKRFEQVGVRVARLNTSHAFHSELMEPVLDGVEGALAGLAVAAPSVALVSNVTGREVGEGERLEGAYWRRQARQPVAFAAGVRTLAEAGVDVVVEIGPQAVLGPLIEPAWPTGRSDGEQPPPAVVASLQRAGRAASGFLRAVAGVYEAGVGLAFEGLFAGESRRRVSLPGYPFQRERFWVQARKRQMRGRGHPLLGVRRDSARGGLTYETELYSRDPAWLADHQVFGIVVVPAALYGVLGLEAGTRTGGSKAVALEELQLYEPLVLAWETPAGAADGEGRTVQVALDGPGESGGQVFEVYSKGREETAWQLHAKGRLTAARPATRRAVDLEALREGLACVEVRDLYLAIAQRGIEYGPAFRGLAAAWAGPGEAVGEVVLAPEVASGRLLLHPAQLDACLHLIGALQDADSKGSSDAYMPFGWERLWLSGPVSGRVTCHVRMREDGREGPAGVGAPETLVADVRLYGRGGAALGGISGLVLKRAPRAALLSAAEGVEDLLYELAWRERSWPAGPQPAGFLAEPQAVRGLGGSVAEWLEEEGVPPGSWEPLQADLERLSGSYALAGLEALGWRRERGAVVDSSRLRRELRVVAEHGRLLRCLLGKLARAGVLERGATDSGGWVVAAGAGEALPGGLEETPAALGERLAERHSHAALELGLLMRCGEALAEVLRGRADPAELLHGDGCGVAELYGEAPHLRAASRMLGAAVRLLVDGLPEGRRLQVLEVGAGTGGATAEVLAALPAGRFDYACTDVSAEFIAEAERRIGGRFPEVEYRVLDIEADPAAQGLEAHGYDLVVATNVLHATRDLRKTLAHCRGLLAPAGQLVALEILQPQGWLDLTFGLLEGWWRFDDPYRGEHPLVGAGVWRRALADAGFSDAEVLEGGGGHGVIVARGPVEVEEPPGVWVLAGEGAELVPELAEALVARNQAVVAAGQGTADRAVAGVSWAYVDPPRREAWRSLLEGLPVEPPLRGIVHVGAVAGHGEAATTGELARDAARIGAEALALVQGLLDAAAEPADGLWFVTRGGQVVHHERAGLLAGATLWGLGKTVAQEAPQLGPRMVDLDPLETVRPDRLVAELLHGDRETHVAHRGGTRHVARLVRGMRAAGQPLPEEPGWRLASDPGGDLNGLGVEAAGLAAPGPGEVRVAVAAAGLNFKDVLIAMGVVDAHTPLGGEFCGRVTATGPGVTSLAVGERVAGLAAGTFGPEVVTRHELVARAPAGVPEAALATVPTTFATAALAFELAGVEAGERVLVHAGAGGVGLAAIQLARAAGARVIATASARKRAYLRSLGVEHAFDSRSTEFGGQIRAVTEGAGVRMVLNSLTGPGFIEASLACLGAGGRFVEIGRRDIWSRERMGAARPDVDYHVLALDELANQEPARVGAVLRAVMGRVGAGELEPLPFSAWPLAEAGAAMAHMRSGLHVGKIVLRLPPLAAGGLRQDGTYLVTGGLAGIGRLVAGWLADRGARWIVLNGRREPDLEAEAAIAALRGRGVEVRVELADVTDAAAVDGMLGRIDADMPPLAGVVHCAGVLADASLGNQDWERFERVLGPKMLGAWQLHRATAGRDLDLFVQFSSGVGVLGNAGQANHAAANAFLDQLARHRQAMGLAGQSVAWGAWSGVGVAEEQRSRIGERLAAAGVGWIAPQRGLRSLDRLVRQDAVNGIVLAVDWQQFVSRLPATRRLLEEVVDSGAAPADTASRADLAERLRQVPASEREGLLAGFLQGEVREVLRMASPPDIAAGFFDLGMDSLMAVELRGRLKRALGGDYEPASTVVFDYPDVASLARHLAAELAGVGAAEIEQQPCVRSEAGADAIAIVGMACRFPGGPDLSAFWRQLEEARCAVTAGRQGSPVGPTEADFVGGLDEADARRWGAFIDGIDRFDARFFRISPLEAELLDPQQRLLLETSWLALEDAGVAPSRLRGGRSGVYVGISTSDYSRLIDRAGQGIAGLYAATGTSASTAIGRVAFALGLEGPAMAVDTACSSSLVAVHQAAVALQRGEADLALAGGVNAILTATGAEVFTKAGMLAADGLCKTFDASADGYVRGEGCGVVVLKRLREAQADGDRIWAVIRGSAVNQDGASAGLTVPNGPAQERVIGEALARAGLRPADVDYLEAHGTGTELGDPIEVQAAAAAYGPGREPGRPLLVGSVKTNVGHLEAAAGIAGLIKVALSMERGTLPRHLHFRKPNPRIDWAGLPVEVTAEARPWPETPGRPARAGVSSFGFSGTNAHLVLEAPAADGAGRGLAVPAVREAPHAVAAPEPRGWRLLPLSGRSRRAVRELAGRYLSWLGSRRGAFSDGDADPATLLADMAWTAAVGRTHFRYRAGLVHGDLEELRRDLEGLAAGGQVARAGREPKVAFVFTGQGSQWAGMGRWLYEREPVARAVLDRCEREMRKLRGASLLEVMFGRSGAAGDLDDTAWTQPALYALECALAAQWASVGVRPAAVLGHSVGEIAAARVAGVFGLEAGLRFAAARGDLMASLPADGAMLAVFAPARRVAVALAEHNAGLDGPGLSLAAENGAHRVVSGPTAEIEALAKRFEQVGVRVARLNTSHAFHSALMEPVLEGIEEALAGLDVEAPTVALVSNVTGRPVREGERLDGAYWRRQAREPVAFAASVAALAEIGVGLVVEVGPRAVLGPLVGPAWPVDSGAGGLPAPAVVTSLRGEGGPPGAFARAVAGAYEAGVGLAFEGLFAGETRRRVSLPGYPFQRERFWVQARKRQMRGWDHPLLGVRRDSARGERTYESELHAGEPAWLADHRVFGAIVVPGALYGALGLEAATLAGGNGAVALEDLQLHEPLALYPSAPDEAADSEARTVQVVLNGPDDSSGQVFEVHSRGREETSWRLHAKARLTTGEAGADRALDPAALRKGLARVAVRDLYRGMAERGIEYGPAFRGLAAAWGGPGEAVGEVVLAPELDSGGLMLHPAQLDACLHLVSAVQWADGGRASDAYMPFRWERLWLTEPVTGTVVCHARMREAGQQDPAKAAASELLVADIGIYDTRGKPLGGIRGLVLKRATRAALLSMTEGVEDLLHEVVWRERPWPTGLQPAGFLAEPGAACGLRGSFAEWLDAEGVAPASWEVVFGDLERLSRSYALSALESLGWRRERGATVDASRLRRELRVVGDHRQLFERLLGMLAETGMLDAGREGHQGWVVAKGAGDDLPAGLAHVPGVLADRLTERHSYAAHELGLLTRCGEALAEVLRGRADPLDLLFGDATPGAAAYYREAPAMRAANRMLGSAVHALVAEVPEGQRLRVLEVGAGTGSATAEVLRALPAGEHHYAFTDISAGFFAAAEDRLGSQPSEIEYRVLDIEADPTAQGLDAHGYHLVIAANVLHATQDLKAALAHCRALLAPAGQLVALETLQPQGWLDLTFGLLDGWWRFDDEYRDEHAVVDADVWRRALKETGFGGVEVLEGGVGNAVSPGVIVARAPLEVEETGGLWVLAGEGSGLVPELAEALAARNQAVIVAAEGTAKAPSQAGVTSAYVDSARREAWRSLLEELPAEPPLRGVVHLGALAGHGEAATTVELAHDAARIGSGALALVQGMVDASAEPAAGLWFVTLGAQVVEREQGCNLAGATLWGMGKTVALEAPQLRPRMVDLDPQNPAAPDRLADELLHADLETHVAHRGRTRHGARLVRGLRRASVQLPDEPSWHLARDHGGTLQCLRSAEAEQAELGPGEVRVGLFAAGLNARDVLNPAGAAAHDAFGREFCGRVVATGSAVTSVAKGDRVVGLGAGAVRPEVVTREELVARVPARMPAAAWATLPMAYVTAALTFELAGLEPGERVLVHAASGGLGLAAVRMARRAGAKVVATATSRARGHLQPLGVQHVFDSRTPAFAGEVLAVTGGEGVAMVVNGPSGQGLVEASLSCLGAGGRFVELGNHQIWSAERMAAARPDVAYHVLAIDEFARDQPARVGAVLRAVIQGVEAGELEPLPYSAFPLADAALAMDRMRSGREAGRIALTLPPLAVGGLVEDGTYLVTGGLAGIGRLAAGWLADRGARWIVLNGRRGPDDAGQAAVKALRERGVEVRVELADVADSAAVEGMLERVEATMPPLAGVIHSAGAIADASLANQDWGRFERVLRPKVLGAWHLHKATQSRDLNLFVLFSSVSGVLGNAGQANHAAANAFLDQLARHRRSIGLAGQSIAWGAWSGVGEAEEQRARIAKHLAAAGMGWIVPRRGLRVLDRLVREDAVHSVAVPVDWPRFASRLPASQALLSEVVTSERDSGRRFTQAVLAERLRAVSDGERERLLSGFLQGEVQAVLRLASPPDTSAGFFDLGMDSLMAVELTNRLNRALAGECSVSSSLVFDHPDINALAGHLSSELGLVEDRPAQIGEHASARNDNEPVAIVGMACRFPRGDGLSSFWRQLESGESAVANGRPDSRVRLGSFGNGGGSKGRDSLLWGGYVKGIDQFDAAFFRITPPEARLMDPQHRLLLETTWHALEEAGLAGNSLAGSRTGVYAGIAPSDYREIVLRAGAETAGLYSATGSIASTAIGRIAFSLGLQGPAVAVDTACSSSLVAVHQAMAALQRGEADLALAGGVNAILTTTATETLAKAGAIARDGRCKTFDASADGYVRSEGCGMVVLKRLSEAESDGDRIWAVLRGSAVNQDGASAGLTVPNGSAQQRVIEEALDRSGLEPVGVDYLEAHGTGTELGDPVEVHAAAAVYGRGRPSQRPLLIGSVKTNVGHLEAAAGIAGLIKVVLSLQHGLIPKHLHLQTPNPRIDWDELPVRITTEALPWPASSGRPMRAAVSSFGISGTNAHLIVEGYAGGHENARVRTRGPVADSERLTGSQPPTEEVLQPREARLLPLSGRSQGALRDLAVQYRSWLELGTEHAFSPDWRAGGDTGARSEPSMADIAWNASVGRSHFHHRAGLVFSSMEDLQKRLNRLIAGEEGHKAVQEPKIAFAFAGQGGQWAGMGRSLYESEPVVRGVLDRCDQVIRQLRGVSLLEVMFGSAGAAGHVDSTAWAQPALYALECALAALWRSLGIRPMAVLGHSAGEIAAAQAAGVFGLEDGLRFAAARGELMGTLPAAGPDAGTMLAVFDSPERVAVALAEHNAATEGVGLSLAAENGTHRVVAGPRADVAALAGRFRAAGVRVVRLSASLAFHSALMDPVLDEIEAAADMLAVAQPAVPVISNLTGRAIRDRDQLDGAYWRLQARAPVGFREGVETLAELGAELVIEIGPTPVLGPLVEQIWPARLSDGTATELAVVATQRKAAGGASEFVDAVAGAYEAGAKLDFEGLFAGETRRKVSLPTYPFQRKRYWVATGQPQGARSGHGLLGMRRDSAGGEVTFENALSVSDPEWLGDHRVFGLAVAPAALYGSVAAEAAALIAGSGSAEIENLQILAPLVLDDAGGNEDGRAPEKILQVVVNRVERSVVHEVGIYSKAREAGEWTLHATARSVARGTAEESGVDLRELKQGLSPVTVSELYANLAQSGIGYGPSFRAVEVVWSGRDQAIGEVALPPELDSVESLVHPAQLDGCIQVVAAMSNLGASSVGGTYVPLSWDRFWLARAIPERVVCHATRRTRGHVGLDSAEASQTLVADLAFFDPEGAQLGGISGLVLRRVTRVALLSATEGVEDLLHEVVWRRGSHVRGIQSADFLAKPARVSELRDSFAQSLGAAGVSPAAWHGLLADLGRLARSYALEGLESLGWHREAGAVVDPSRLRRQLKVVADHEKLFGRLLQMMAEAGVLKPRVAGSGSWVVAMGVDDVLPEGLVADPQALGERLLRRHEHGTHELGLLMRCGQALTDVLRGRADPLDVLFGGDGGGAADLYQNAPALRATNRLVGAIVALLVQGLPEGRRLRVLEVGAGTGSATAEVLPVLPSGRFDYVYSDISAGFFASAEERLGGRQQGLEFRSLNIEADPAGQGLDVHGFDLLIAANVLHATHDLRETLEHCRRLLAPAGQMVALEALTPQEWLDLTFGLLEGWWRFDDQYRGDHALLGAKAWQQALAEAGFGDVQVLEAAVEQDVLHGVIVARAPSEVEQQPGLWVLAGEGSALVGDLAQRLVTCNQAVIVAGQQPARGTAKLAGVDWACMHTAEREAWRSLLDDLPADIPFRGVVHLGGLEGHGAAATTAGMRADVARIGAEALALVQGLQDAGAKPMDGVCFVTRGGQVVHKEGCGELAGAMLWGLGSALAQEVPQFRPRMVDLDPRDRIRPDSLVNELLHGDRETHVAHRGTARYVARLVRGLRARGLRLPEVPAWRLARQAGDARDGLAVDTAGLARPETGEVRVAVAAAGLNPPDLLGKPQGDSGHGSLGREFAGQVLSTGPGVATVAVGDRVVGLASGAFGPEAVTREELVAEAPAGLPAAALATAPRSYVTAALAFKLADIRAGQTVLVHAGAGDVGLAAIQLARAAGAEVIATASAWKHAHLRSLGVERVFDGRTGGLGEQVLDITGGAGVAIVLNSPSGPGLVESSLACLCRGGRFVETSGRHAWSAAEIAAIRRDVDYHVLDLDRLVIEEPARVGAQLRAVMRRLEAGELRPLPYEAWPMAEAEAAMEHLRSGRQVGKVVLTLPPLAAGRLREDGTYLITGGLAGIGLLAAGWLADCGARWIVLNGRREPEAGAEQAIAALRDRGIEVRVELADVTDSEAMDSMLGRIEASMPPLAGVIHSAGVIADASLANQSWERFERVLGPKVLGAWHLHRATAGRDLDLFALFSSVAGVLGSAGQANHAAANAFLDQLARHRRSMGLAGQSIAWGAWSGTGEAEESWERISAKLAAAGIGWMSPRRGLQVLERLVRDDVETGVAAPIDWPQFTSRLASTPLLLEELAEPDDPSPELIGVPEDLLGRLRKASPDGREGIMVEFVQRQVHAVLGIDSPPNPKQGFFDLGMDSLMAVELRNRLNRALAGEHTVSSTVVFDYPRVSALARHLIGAVGALRATDELAAQRSSPDQSARGRREDEERARIASLEEDDFLTEAFASLGEEFSDEDDG